MKKHWLGGTLLGLSLALLLAAGVAVANGLLYAEVDKPCVECVHEGELISDDNVLTVTYGGWSDYPDDYGLCDGFVAPGTAILCVARMLPQEDPLTDQFGPCPCPGEPDEIMDCGDLGEWRFDAWVTDEGVIPVGSAVVDEVSVSFLFLEECPEPEVEEEFVPEPGTIMLLGSGLMGLAGYATLRWRTRE